MKKLLMAPLAMAITGAVVFAVSSPVAAAYNAVWDQGFEEDTTGWFGDITQHTSGDLGITASKGDGFALIEEAGPYSRFDGYRDTWPGDWTAEIDVYLDTNWDAGDGFDYSVASSGSDGDHQRDFIFHVTKDTSTGDLLVGASNNTNFAPREDLENINHYNVTTSGWYTLQHVFYDDGGTLAVDMNLLDDQGNVLFTETRSDASDAIPAEIGGNRYSWFTTMTLEGGLAVDEHQLLLPLPSKADILMESGVEGKGLEKAKGLEKSFNPKSQAGEHAGKKN